MEVQKTLLFRYPVLVHRCLAFYRNELFQIPPGSNGQEDRGRDRGHARFDGNIPNEVVTIVGT